MLEAVPVNGIYRQRQIHTHTHISLDSEWDFLLSKLFNPMNSYMYAMSNYENQMKHFNYRMPYETTMKKKRPH